jgi:hypothetical protein
VTWRLAIRCSKCGQGRDYVEGMERGDLNTTVDLCHCEKCGGTRFEDARPGRLRRSWWPWSAAFWEWNDDPEEVRVLPRRSTGKLVPIDGGKK